MISHKIITLVMAMVLVLPLGIQVTTAEKIVCPEGMDKQECKDYKKEQKAIAKEEKKNPSQQFTACDIDSSGGIEAEEITAHADPQVNADTAQALVNAANNENFVEDTNSDQDIDTAGELAFLNGEFGNVGIPPCV